MGMSSRFTADEAFEAEGDDPIMMTYGAVLRTFRDHGLNDPQDFADFCADCGFNAQVASREYDAAVVLRWLGY